MIQQSLGASYIDTERVDVRTPLIEGEPLPYAPRTNAILGLQYHFTANGYNSYVRTDIAYVGKYKSAPAWLALLRMDQPSGDYVNVNFRVGMTIEQWDLSIYAKNLSNNDELLVHATGIGQESVGIRSRPRQVGVAFNYSF